jgi:transposase-like protein
MISNSIERAARCDNLISMRKSDVICPRCCAGYRRIELVSRPGDSGEFRCLSCNLLLEVFDGTHDVAMRLTVQPERARATAGKRLEN